MVITIIICSILLIISCILFAKAKNIRIQKYAEKVLVESQLKDLKQEVDNKTYQLEQTKREEAEAQHQINALYEKHSKLQTQLNEDIAKKKDTLEHFYQEVEDSQFDKYNNYEKIIDNAYKTKEKEINQQIEELNTRRASVQAELDQVKTSLTAAAAANLRRQEEENKLDFYKIQLPPNTYDDIVKTEEFKKSLHNPTIASKIIWSGYIMKATNELCTRVLKNKNVCGIYKITNSLTDQMYIGQSVDIASRWKQHVKCGLGIDSPSTNKLYNAMQKDGVYNFTFELMEECDRSDLNERERFWIDMYQSDKFGYNGNTGVKK